MKKVLFMAAVAVFGLSNLNAQEDTKTPGFANGDLFVSGTVGFNSESQGDFKTNDLTFMPTVGYFVSDNIALEFSLMVGSGKEEFNEFENKTSSFGAGIGGTYFFTPADRFSFTVGAGISYLSAKSEPEGGQELTVNAFGVAVGPGVNYFISNSFALRASIGALSYTSAKADEEGAEALNSFGLNLDLSDINFGITYKF